jgi:hypothetical protein
MRVIDDSAAALFVSFVKPSMLSSRSAPLFFREDPNVPPLPDEQEGERINNGSAYDLPNLLAPPSWSTTAQWRSALESTQVSSALPDVTSKTLAAPALLSFVGFFSRKER